MSHVIPLYYSVWVQLTSAEFSTDRDCLQVKMITCTTTTEMEQVSLHTVSQDIEIISDQVYKNEY